MMHCSVHKLDFEGASCPRCGVGSGAEVSVQTDTLDSLVQAASVPNLADLFRKAKETGAIGAVSVYGAAEGGA